MQLFALFTVFLIFSFLLSFFQEAVNEVMQRVPLLKEIVDHYSGPDRVTAKQQGEELERVAKTIPESVPASIKQFANRAVLSLQVSFILEVNLIWNVLFIGVLHLLLKLVYIIHALKVIGCEAARRNWRLFHNCHSVKVQ